MPGAREVEGRSNRYDRHGVLHGLHDSVAGRPPHQSDGIPFQCQAHAIHGTGLRRRGHGAGTGSRLLEGRTGRKRPDHRRGAALTHVSAQGHFASQPDFFDSIRGRGRGRGGQRKTNPGPKILVSETYTFPDSLGAMGFDLRDSGFHILLAKDVPEMIGGRIAGLVEGFLDRHGRKREEIKGWILHPGGARLLGNIETELALCKCDTQPSWDILGNVGNLSSATILFILQEWLEKRPLQPGEYALAAAFGPGFSAEFLLLPWT